MVDTRAGRSPMKTWSLASALTVVLAMLGALMALPASADPVAKGTFAGTVLLPDGTPAAGVTVEVIDAGAWYTPPLATATTAADGSYEVDAPAGTYLLRFVDPSGDHLWSVHQGRAETPDDLPSATGLPVAAGETVGVDHDLIRSGSVRGKISVADDVDPTEISITAYYPRPTMGNPPARPAQWGRVAADGTYVIPMRPGEYYLEFLHPDELVESHHHTVRVAGTDVTKVDVALRRTNSISGVVRVPASNAGEDVRISARPLEDGGRWGWATKSVVVEAGEPYRLAGLGRGVYRLEFSPASSSSSLATSVWPGVSFVEQGTDVLVIGDKDHPGYDGELVVGGAVTGQVDPDLGLYQDSTTVELWRLAPSNLGPATWQGLGTSYVIEDDGSFRIPGVSAGRYRLKVQGLSGPDWEVFHPAARTVQAGRDFDAVLGETTASVDVTVPTTVPPSPEPTPEPTPDPEPALKTLKRLKAPKVTGKAELGRTLKVSKGTWKPRSVKVTYRWFSKKGDKVVKVKSTKKPTLKLKRSTLGKKYRVVVTVSKPGYRTVKHTTKWSKKIKR